MIGSRIKELRLKNKITLKGLNKLTGLAVSNITRIEQNQVNPSVGTLEKIAIALKCKQIDFFVDDDTINEPAVACDDKKDIKGFTVALIDRLLSEGIIEDKDNIPQEVIAAIVASLKLDLNNKKN